LRMCGALTEDDMTGNRESGSSGRKGLHELSSR